MAEEAISSNKRIAKNTLMLYIRMLLSMVVSLYTSRVVLNTLGVEDYGIYGVVGGVVAMFGFLNASMSGATSRFLTYEMGCGDEQRLKDTFSSALLVHIGIALVVLFLAETVGLWFLMHKLVIPEERMFAAHVVYQLSILSTMVSITQVPYNAAIIAHEKMDIYAYVELLNVSLKLLIVFLLPILGNDKLIVYGILVFVVSVLIALIYRWYCFNRYQESHFRFVFNKNIIYPILSFSGWDLYGNLGARMYQQGTVMLLNMFFGVALNAASSIATTVQGVISSFSGNIVMAFRPQIIKLYAKGEARKMFDMFITAGQLSSILMVIIIVPLSSELSYVMKIWLVEVPDYAVDICVILLYTSIINQLQMICNIVIHATGKIKSLSFYTGSIFFSSVFFVYILFRQTHVPLSAYYFFLLIHIIILLNDLRIIKKEIETISLKVYYLKVIIPVFMLLVLGNIVIILLHHFIVAASLLRLILVTFLSSFATLSFSYFVILNKQQQEYIKKKFFVK